MKCKNALARATCRNASGNDSSVSGVFESGLRLFRPIAHVGSLEKCVGSAVQFPLITPKLILGVTT
ncbi:hypothetical protein E2C01_010180 [Portunus trituberculatus]|uniref:Uncharacterized protein n=1 Tax=Portunus trituberculatus TaxID=210409 RepID=A0A5B7D7R7_PORTR|nr:hypothetical protein [Portunus trituberculatus]